MTQSALQLDDATLVRAHTSLGDFDLTVCTDGIYLLDGGAMFGVVPKTLWQKRISANADNQISEIETLMSKMDGLAISSVSSDALGPVIEHLQLHTPH